MRKLLVVACLLSPGATARGQAASATRATQMKLNKIAVAAENLEKHLPSFACKETLISQEISGGKVKRLVQAVGELRVQRDRDGKLGEHFQATQRNGQPVTPGPLRLPIFVSGGFKNALDLFRTKMQSCFDFVATGNRIDFESSREAYGSDCKDQSAIKGFAFLNDVGDVAHVERRIPQDVAQRRNAVPFGSIDLNRVELGDTSFLLATHVITETPKGKSVYRWEATYSECRLFSTSVKIGPATATPGAEGADQGSVQRHP